MMGWIIIILGLVFLVVSIITLFFQFKTYISKHPIVKILIVIVFFVVGIILVFWGWRSISRGQDSLDYEDIQGEDLSHDKDFKSVIDASGKMLEIRVREDTITIGTSDFTLKEFESNVEYFSDKEIRIYLYDDYALASTYHAVIDSLKKNNNITIIEKVEY